MSGISGLYLPLPQSLSDSDSEKEQLNENVASNYKNSRLKNWQMKQSKNDATTIIAPNMTLSRKVALFFSITMCFIPVFLFLWILPCDADTCHIKVSNWITQQEGIELKGSISPIYEGFKKTFNLVFQYKGDMNSKDTLKHGVLSIFGNNGGINWYFRQSVIPDELNCSLIDTNADGIFDCLLMDEKGLKAFEVTTGQIVWHVHSHDIQIVIENLQFPIVIGDWNRDGINELLSIYSKKYLMVICGRTGRAIKNILVEKCNELQNLSSNNGFIFFTCRTEESINLKVEISEIFKKFLNNSYNLLYGNYSENFEKNTYDLDAFKLRITNVGICPNCSAKFELFNSKSKLVISKSYNRSYIIKPPSFHFKAPSKRPSKGFLIKIWNWYETFSSNQFTGQFVNGNIIIEHIILLIFNSSDYNIIEASSTNITQLCFLNDLRDHCQPDIKNQENSLLITDIDRDGSQELISFSSSFHLRENPTIGMSTWHLISSIKLLKLELELSKLYDTKQTFKLLPSF